MKAYIYNTNLLMQRTNPGSMKKIAGIILAIFFCSCETALSVPGSLYDTSSYSSNFVHYNMSLYRDTVLVDDFYNHFSAETDLVNFRKLRQYRLEKITLIEMVEKEIRKYSDIEEKLAVCENDSVLLGRFIQMKKTDGDSISFQQMGSEENLFYDLARRYGMSYLFAVKVDGVHVDQLKKLMTLVKKRAILYEDGNIDVQNLRANYHIITAEVMHVNDAIDYALAPEYHQQTFRQDISTVFSILIGLLLVVFFGIVYLKGHKDIGRELLGGTGLQFISLFILIISITLFGILGILGGSELAAILSGISGYVLGKGVYGFGGDKSQVAVQAAENRSAG
jgi:hypothetical protein